ncbi:hypothetical protein PK28_17090 (plasmid) [Hymenobacter sp. DG25B]|uniref:hypothetical protein n=1 Tax=Hymenobacter sp. DG25B TaxID=1385664 RepID=UPI000540EFA0|nr:hypothetical protein [Hymenobacter sp. DG25B]AIZ65388.1 hypothetical protein PK28_17090 [Hymenobacter sp. DG25B]
MLRQLILPLSSSIWLAACGDAPSVQQRERGGAIPVGKAAAPQALAQPTTPADTVSVASGKQGWAILPLGTFHAEEVFEAAAQQAWVGIFRGPQGYYLQPTSLQTARVVDEIEGGEKTGWSLSTPNTDTTLLLIRGLPLREKRPVEAVPELQRAFWPGERVEFTYQGVAYALFATGPRSTLPASTESVVTNYQLFLTTRRQGQPITQRLLAQPSLDDEMIDIRFGGDLDGDHRLDLLLDKSSHHNVTNPALFLSRPAPPGALLKEVAEHESVGC